MLGDFLIIVVFLTIISSPLWMFLIWYQKSGRANRAMIRKIDRETEHAMNLGIIQQRSNERVTQKVLDRQMRRGY
jgi:hypothetical protein